MVLTVKPTLPSLIHYPSPDAQSDSPTLPRSSPHTVPLERAQWLQHRPAPTLPIVCYRLPAGAGRRARAAHAGGAARGSGH
eukprot:364195-Chlamydomonas_euryale.AAC.4